MLHISLKIIHSLLIASLLGSAAADMIDCVDIRSDVSSVMSHKSLISSGTDSIGGMTGDMSRTV